MFNSIKARWLLATIVSMPILIYLVGNALTNAHRDSLLEGVKAQLNLHVYALISAADLAGSKIWIPGDLAEKRMNQLDSGLFSAIYREGNEDPEWSSASAVGVLDSLKNSSVSFNSGQTRFSEAIIGRAGFFRLDFDVLWENDRGDPLGFRFSVYENIADFESQIGRYQETLWFWLVLTLLGLVLIQLAILFWGMRPFAQMAKDLDAVREGQSEQLEGRYPTELSTIVQSVNALLGHEMSLRERYRNTMADLAHSIKTPLAIIKGLLGNETKIQNGEVSKESEELNKQADRIDQIISYQLKRAVGASNPLGKGIKIRPISEKIVGALKKAYVAKNVAVDLECDDSLFRGDEGDLYELLGNVLENAFKYGDDHICVQIIKNKESLDIHVSDNGPGIPSDLVDVVTQRGARVDTSLPGQGIGLAVVSDIVASYGGNLNISASELGGAMVSLSFPNKL